MLPASVRIFLCTAPVDLRRSFDGLAAAARDVLGQDPESGALFVFVNRRGNRLKALWWDRTGYCLLYKRLEWGCFQLPTPLPPEAQSVQVDVRELAKILEGIDLPPRRHRLHARAVQHAAGEPLQSQSDRVSPS